MRDCGSSGGTYRGGEGRAPGVRGLGPQSGQVIFVSLEQLDILETIRRKVVASFTSRVHRVRFDVAVQTSNAYRFNLIIMERPAHGDLGSPLLKPRPEAESEVRFEPAIKF
jgi:hypothetical protein